MNEPKQDYGWVTCKHDDPERLEVYATHSGRWIATVRHDGPENSYRKRPLAPDGLKFTDPACEWEMLKEGDMVMNGDMNFGPQDSKWIPCHYTVNTLAVLHEYTAAFARRKQPAVEAAKNPDGWKYFATDGPPKEGDYPVVTFSKNRDLCALRVCADYTWDDEFAWRTINLPSVSPKKSAAEVAWEEYKSNRSHLDSILTKDAFLAGYNAALKIKEESK